MTPATLAALKASIKHHEDNRDCPEKATLGPDGCALCRLFIVNECRGCPVSIRTGVPGCTGSPYEHAFWALSAFRRHTNNSERKAFKIAEQREIDFLKSLLPDGEKESVK